MFSRPSQPVPSVALTKLQGHHYEPGEPAHRAALALTVACLSQPIKKLSTMEIGFANATTSDMALPCVHGPKLTVLSGAGAADYKWRSRYLPDRGRHMPRRHRQQSQDLAMPERATTSGAELDHSPVEPIDTPLTTDTTPPMCRTIGEPAG